MSPWVQPAADQQQQQQTQQQQQQEEQQQQGVGKVVLAAALPQEQAAAREAGQEAEEAGHEAEQDEEEDNEYETAGTMNIRRQGSMRSVMAGVRERMGMLHGTQAGGLLSPSEREEAVRNCHRVGTGAGGIYFSEAHARSQISGGSPDPTPARVQASSKCQGTSKKAYHQSEFSGSQKPQGKHKLCSSFTCTIPFRVAVICPTIIMLLACIGVFVPLAVLSMESQEATFIAYRHSVQTQRELIRLTVLNATSWILLEALNSVEQAVFVGIVEPSDRAVDTLSGAMRIIRQRHGWDFIDETQRRTLSLRAWEELNNQWTCTQLNNNLCSGRALGVYVALAGEQLTGAAFRPPFWGSDLGAASQFLLDSPGGFPGLPTTLIVWEADTLTGDRINVSSSRPYFPTRQHFYATQALLASIAAASPPNASDPQTMDVIGDSAQQPEPGRPRKMWSQLYLLSPWWPEQNNTSMQLALSWTAPIAPCGNYSCLHGVVAADSTLDLVSRELYLARRTLHAELLRAPWNFRVEYDSSSMFIVNQVSPYTPEQMGVLVGASDVRSSMRYGELTRAVDSPSTVVSATARALLLRFGTWNAAELTKIGVELSDDQSLHFSLSAAQRGDFLECDPMMAGGEASLDCLQAITHSMFLDDTLQWLVVVVMPSAAFSRFYVAKAVEVDEEVRAEQRHAEERNRELLVRCAVMAVLVAVLVLLLLLIFFVFFKKTANLIRFLQFFIFLLGLGTSLLVLRPLRRLRLLMRRLGQLDFAHDSAEYRQLAKGRRGRVREVNELQDGFCRLSRSIEVFARFVPDSVVRSLVSGDPRATRLNVCGRNVSIMFSDIRDFTSISEELSQDDLMFVLTLYLSVMTRVVESYEGIVGEILGDGILAFWNTPDDVEDHAAKACEAALAQQRALVPLNAELKNLGLPQLSIRIGVHTGDVLTGNIGSETKMKFGCMGDPVNLASRLEGLCKIYEVGVICSGVTRALLPSGFVCRKLDTVQVKGKREPTTIFEVIGHDIGASAFKVLGRESPRSWDVMSEAASSPQLVRTGTLLSLPCCRRNAEAAAAAAAAADDALLAARAVHARLYERALEAYSSARFAEAEALAAQLLEERPEDVAAARLRERAETAMGGSRILTREELAEWTGIVMMTDK
ncbi:unnamed protein product [Polarella glacialis]|uniref:Guanylate cyclase domain-containing protein n=1 Tax=Polarella glacialis TaxID=89957 RepID=A0A813GDR5_POLGL|nr:unnamed protein product [Polarella glacialis]